MITIAPTTVTRKERRRDTAVPKAAVPKAAVPKAAVCRAGARKEEGRHVMELPELGFGRESRFRERNGC